MQGSGNNVPGLEQSPQFSQNVPGVQFPFRQEFGRAGASIEHLGEGIDSLAQSGGEVYDEVQRQHDISTAKTNFVDAGIQHSQQIQNLKLGSPDGFVRDQTTGEVIQNKDGTQRTIAQQYWDYADQDYQARQQNMSPRAAAMFRESMLPHIGENTKTLQNDGLLMQRASAEQSVNTSMANLARDNDRQPWSDQNPYLQEVRPDGSINLRGNTDKINDQLRTLQLWTTQQGPKDGKIGMYAAPEVQKMLEKRLSEHSESWVKSAITDILENDTPRDHKNRVSTTAVQQVMNLRDVIEGKDAQSVAARAKGLPTVGTSLTANQIDEYRTKLNAMLDGAKKLDKTDYEFQLQQMKGATDSGKYPTFDALVHSPEFGYLIHASEPLGMKPEETMKDMSEIFGNAARTTSYLPGKDLTSDAAKRKQIDENLRSFEVGLPQFAKMMGVGFTGAMQNAVIGEAKNHAYAKLDEETKQFKEDPAKFAASTGSGADGKPRSPMMKGVEDQLYRDPSLFAAVKPMSNGKPLLQNAIQEMKRVGAMGFGQGFEVPFLSKESMEAQASKINQSNDPEQIERFFQQTQKAAGRDAGTFLDQLVKIGKLDPRFQTAQNLPTAQARIAAYADILSKGAAVDAYTKSESGESEKEVMQKAQKALEGPIDFNNRLYGADSPGASKVNKAALQTWASAYSAAMGVKGTSQSDAARAASEKVAAMIPPVSSVGDQHHFLGFSFGSSGAQSKVQFSRPGLSEDQQQTIRENLAMAQKEEALSKHTLAPAPVAQGAYDFNPKLNAKWISEHPFIWAPTPKNGGYSYRLFYQGMNADGSPNGDRYPVRVKGPDGDQFYEVPEAQALKKAGKP